MTWAVGVDWWSFVSGALAALWVVAVCWMARRVWVGASQLVDELAAEYGRPAGRHRRGWRLETRQRSAVVVGVLRRAAVADPDETQAIGGARVGQLEPAEASAVGDPIDVVA